MRGAGLAYALQKEHIDLNGVILLSDILNWDLVPDDPELNPGIDEPYIVSLPSYAATAWYHHKLANRLCRGVDHLCAQDAQIWCRPDLQGGHPCLQKLGLQAPAARRIPSLDRATECIAGPCRGDEAESRPQGHGQWRLFRHLHALLRRQVRTGASSDSCLAAQEHRIPLLRIRPHGVRHAIEACRTARQRRGLHSRDGQREMMPITPRDQEQAKPRNRDGGS
jgi:hypothetical protein